MILDPENVFESLQNDVAGALMAATLFQDINMPDGTAWQVLTEDEGDIEYLFTKMISECGLSVIVQSATGEIPQPDLPGPVISPLQFAVSISEAVIFNRSELGTGVRLHKALVTVLATLHGFVPSSVGTPIYAFQILKDRDSHPETGALVASKICLFKAPLASAALSASPD